MKQNIEAWQLGNEDGWDDGYNDRQPKTKFDFPPNWTDDEKRNYTVGYSEGYNQGAADC